MTKENIQAEFNRQVDNLIAKGYTTELNLSEQELKDRLAPLSKALLESDLPEVDLEKGTLPFVIVVKSDLQEANKMMALVDKNGKAGISKLFPHEPTDFSVVESVELPQDDFYLLINIDRGRESLNITPEIGMEMILKNGRSPLTIDEGIAIVTHYPEFLMKNNCFSLLASRHAGDQRVPAIWINGAKHPNLGWCWERNPHTWLGSASCESRV